MIKIKTLRLKWNKSKNEREGERERLLKICCAFFAFLKIEKESFLYIIMQSTNLHTKFQKLKKTQNNWLKFAVKNLNP